MILRFLMRFHILSTERQPARSFAGAVLAPRPFFNNLSMRRSTKQKGPSRRRGLNSFHLISYDSYLDRVNVYLIRNVFMSTVESDILFGDFAHSRLSFGRRTKTDKKRNSQLHIVPAPQSYVHWIHVGSIAMAEMKSHSFVNLSMSQNDDEQRSTIFSVELTDAWSTSHSTREVLLL